MFPAKTFMEKGMKKLFIVMACIIACAVCVTGCSKQNSKTSGKTEIRFASWDSAETLEAQQKLVDRFNETHSDIKVSLEAYGDDYDTKISAGMGSGDVNSTGVGAAGVAEGLPAAPGLLRRAAGDTDGDALIGEQVKGSNLLGQVERVLVAHV